MKTIVIYDSLFGNTKAIAEAVGKALGPDAVVENVRDVIPASLQGTDLLIVGSPTHGGRPSEATKNFLKSILSGSLKETRVAAFDTRGSIEDQGAFVKRLVNFLGYAAKHILKTLQEKGGAAIAEPEGFIVQGKEGPLKEGELERAAAWAQELSRKASS